MPTMKSPDSSSKTSSTSTEDPRMKPRYLETRLLYSDYESNWQNKLISWAKDAIQLVTEKGIETEESFYQEVATMVKESLTSHFVEEKSKKWHFIVGNDFGIQAGAVKDSISFFAIGDVKFLIYRSPSQ